MTTKVCTKCKKLQDRSQYHKDKQKKDGLASHCKSCVKIYSKRAWDVDKKLLVAKHEKEYQFYISKGYVPVKGCENYLINREGKVFSKRRPGGGGFSKLYINNTGYKTFGVDRRPQKPIKLTLHRTLALAFLDNPNNYPCVDHIDGDRLNNNLNNLRWASHSLNSRNRKVTGSILKENCCRVLKGKTYKYTYYRVRYTAPDGKKISKRCGTDINTAKEYLSMLQNTYTRDGKNMEESTYHCRCGSNILKRGLKEHLGSKKHKKYLELLTRED